MCSSPSRTAATTWKTFPSPTPCSSCRRSPPDVALPWSSAPGFSPRSRWVHERGDPERVDRRILEIARLLDELGDQLDRLLRRDAPRHLCAAELTLLTLPERRLDLVQHGRLQIPRQAGAEQLGADTDGARHRAIGLLAAFAAVGPLDQAGAKEHPDVEVQMAGVDGELLGELAVRQRLARLVPEHLEHSESKRMTESLELLRSLDGENVATGGGGGHRH